MKVILLLFLLGTLKIIVSGQFDFVPVGSVCTSTGYISFAETSAMASFNNPTTLCLEKKNQIGLFSKNYYLTSAINCFAGAGVYNIKNLNLSTGFVQTGNEHFRSQQVVIGSSKQISNIFCLSTTILYHTQFIKNTPNRLTGITFKLGSSVELNENLNIYILADNPTQVKIKNSLQDFSYTVYNIGIKYNYEKCTLFAEFEKNNLAKPFLKAALFYTLEEKITLISGFNGLLNSLSFGLKLSKAKVDFLISSQIHPQLGLSPNFGLNVSL